MKPFHARVIRVAYEWRPADRWRKDYTRIAAVILYPPEVKRQLAKREDHRPASTPLGRLPTRPKAFWRSLGVSLVRRWMAALRPRSKAT